MQEKIIKSLVALDQAVVRRHKAQAILEQDFPGDKLSTDKYEAYKVRLAGIQAQFDGDWTKALQNLNELCRRIRVRQPHLTELGTENIHPSSRLPNALAFGRIRLSYENWRGYVPRLVAFPFAQTLRLSNSSDSQHQAHQLLLRLMSALPPKALEVTAMDPVGCGSSLEPFLPLLKLSRPFRHQRLLTKADEMEYALQQAVDYVENMIQTHFNGTIRNWQQYNAANTEQPLPYKVMVLFDVPEQLSDKGLWYLERLIQHGPGCGVLPVMLCDDGRMQQERKYVRLNQGLASYSLDINDLLASQAAYRQLTQLSFKEEQEFSPSRQGWAKIMSWLTACYEQSSVVVGQLDDLWDKTSLWTENSAAGFSASIGWSSSGQKVSLDLGGVTTEHHVLLAGRSGSGKSNLLHVLIHSLCHRYSPAELNIYLLDYKQGTEFSVYAQPPLPQAALVATESDPEYGVTVLLHLKDEMEQRAAKFKQFAVRDIQEYRQKSAAELPRILLIIDEFQQLFAEGRSVAEQAEKLLNILLRQGRAFGMHVILATQTLKGIQSQSMGQMISQIGCRLALACSEEDSSMILGNTNWEAASLNSPPEALLNAANGAKSANQRFLVPFADREACQRHQRVIGQLAYQDGYGSKITVFNGAHLPLLPDESEFVSLVADRQVPALVLGEELSFAAQPFALPLDCQGAGHLLIAGSHRTMQVGLLAAALCSLAADDRVEEIVVFNAQGDQALAKQLEQLRIQKKLTIHEKDWSGDLAGLQAVALQRRKVLIIWGLEAAKILQSGPPSFKPKKPDEPPSPAEVFKDCLEEGHQKGLYVVAFTDSWRRTNNLCKELLACFELRIGFNMNEDDAGAMAFGTIGKLKGLEHGNKAFFLDRIKNRQTWFRPFTITQDN